MAELKILIGYGESGKTTYAKTQDAKLISFDMFSVYSTKFEWENSMKEIAKICNENKNEDYILDGYLSLDNEQIRETNFESLKKYLKHHEIKPIIIFRKAEDIVQSVNERKPICNPDNVDRRFIIHIYEKIISKFGLIETKCFLSKDDKFERLFGYSDIIEKLTGTIESDINMFFKQLEKIEPEKKNGTNYDVKYQVIETFFGRYGGYAGYANETWNGIRDLIDWKDKTVADIGMLNGYYSFKIKDKRAKKVEGFDLFKQACNTCEKIMKLNCYDNMEFKQFDANKDTLENEYDVILMLNMLHHLDNADFALRQAFSKGKNVILEVQFEGFTPKVQEGYKRMENNTKGWNKEIIEELAKTYNHKLVKENPSGRPHRCILHFSKNGK